jgi:hypothetical protein
MTGPASRTKRRALWAAGIALVCVMVAFTTAPGRNLVQKLFSSLRMQKVQAVNVDLSAFVDPNSNPALHQLVVQMISNKLEVTVNDKDQPVSSAAEAAQAAGFPVRLLRARKDPPKLVVTGRHAIQLKLDRTRMQEIVNEAGHPNLVLPQSLDGAGVAVESPPSLRAQYGNCPVPSSATNAIAGNLTGPAPATTQYSDCVRLTEGPSPIVNVPQGLDLGNLAEIGLEVAGMTPNQAHEFLRTVDWKSTLGMSVPRFLRSYETLTVNGAQGTLLTMAGRRGPGYDLIWAKNGMVYSLTGFGDSANAVALADSLK